MDTELVAEWSRVAAYVRCFDHENRVILARIGQDGNPFDGGWTMPGGGMEWGEQPTDTAVREFREETGLSMTLGPLVAARSAWFDADTAFIGKPGHAIGLLFEATDPRGELRTDFSTDDTTIEARWFSLDEVRDLHRVPLVDWALGLA